MLREKLQNYRIILASQSPRRQELLKNLGLVFEVKPVQVDEVFPENLKHKDIALFLSELKANAYNVDNNCENCLIIAADTIVWQDNNILPKPKDEKEAYQILKTLSGDNHDVITGVTLRLKDKQHSFYSDTKVFFKDLTDEEINHYILVYRPFDKAGAYGIQEWIGYIGIEKIEGSYFNVMGLPVQKLYVELLKFVTE